MARRRGPRVLKAEGLRAFVLDDAIGASAPTSQSAPRDEDPGASARELDERVSRWIAERARFERRRQSPPAASAPPIGPPDPAP